MEARRWSLVLAVVAGVLLGAVVTQVVSPPVSGTSVPSHGLATATGCAAPDDPRAWVGVVPNQDHRAVYLVNYSHAHEAPDVEIRAELAETGPDAWALAVTVTPVTSAKDVPETCRPRTVIDASVALPPDAESLTITVDGEPVVVVVTARRAPQFSYLELHDP